MQISNHELGKLSKRLDKLEVEVYYLRKFKQEVEEREYIKKHKRKEKFLANFEKTK